MTAGTRAYQVASSVTHAFIEARFGDVATTRAGELATARSLGRIDVAAISLGYATPDELEVLLLDRCRAMGPYPSCEPLADTAQKKYVASLIDTVLTGMRAEAGDLGSAVICVGCKSEIYP